MKSSSRYFPAVTALACVLATGCGSDSSSGSSAANSGSGPSGPSSANQAPSISGGTPPEATVGQFWVFQPSIFDPDGDRLTVSASNLPGWVSLNSGTGRLSGTPQDGDIRTWSGISLTVSDGLASDRLPTFTVTVVDENAAPGSVTLSWLPPTQQIDGSPIDSLSGYRLLYGQASREYSEAIVINNPGITTYLVEGLSAGDWYFAIQTVDGDGLVSDPSAEARARI